MASVGFIGVGNMGGPMARNLVNAGHQVKVHDLSAEAVNFLTQAGAEDAGSIQGAAGGVDVLVTMLPTGVEARAVFLDNEAIGAADQNTILIDASTIDVATAREVHAAAAAAGHRMLDAPVSGGTVGAEAGTLTFMCGGDKAVFEEAKAVLGGMGKNLVYCGGPGMGQAAKICNNMIAGITVQAVAESFTLGETLGLDRDTLFNVLSTSTADSWCLRNLCPVPGPAPATPSNRDYRPGFAAALMLKDLRLSQAAAQLAGVATPLGAAATATYAMHIANGGGHLDTSSIIKIIQGDKD